MEEIEEVAVANGLMSKPIFSKDLDEAARVIKKGGVVITPAEGVYGLSCNALDDEAVKRVIAIKERDSAKGLITLVSSMTDLQGLVEMSQIDQSIIALMRRLWPGPYTFVVPCEKKCSGKMLTGGRNSIAVRVTSFNTLSTLCQKCAVPLVSTSANLSGAEAVSDFSLISPIILRRVDLALTLPCGGLEGSTSVYDTLSHTLLRRGPMWPKELL